MRRGRVPGFRRCHIVQALPPWPLLQAGIYDAHSVHRWHVLRLNVSHITGRLFSLPTGPSV
eukprot:2091362-Prymnesium_polylepis.1